MERLTNIGSNGEIWIADNDETRRYGRKETAYKKLAEYEDAEEQGFLLRLPCKVGDTVYIPIALNNKIYIGVCRGFKTDKYMGRGMLVEIQYEDGDKSWEDFSSFGKTAFLTKAEAEQKLKEMESD